MEYRSAALRRAPFRLTAIQRSFYIADGGTERSDHWPKHVPPILGKVDAEGWWHWRLDGRMAMLGAFYGRLNLWNRTMGRNFTGVVKCYKIWWYYEPPGCTWRQNASRLIYVIYVGIDSSTRQCRHESIPTFRASSMVCFDKSASWTSV